MSPVHQYDAASADTLSDQPEHTVVLFADLSNSTRLYEAMGDAAAQLIVAKCISELCTVTEKHGGRVVKTAGDGVVCTFVVPANAAIAAAEMHASMRSVSDRVQTPFGDIQARIGMNLGPIIEEEEDVFGEVVKVAAGLERMAKGDQTLISGQLLQALPGEFADSTRFVAKETVVRKPRTLDVYELVWEPEEITQVRDPALENMRTTHTRCLLTMDGYEVQVSDRNPWAMLGRGKECDIQLLNPRVSRIHATIELRRGRFVLTDDSVNGTYVSTEDTGVIYVHRHDYTLVRSGAISLGVSPDGSSDPVVAFFCT